MAIQRLLKTSFTGGEFSPALQARVDIDYFRTGVKAAKNVFIHPQGGMSNRAGFEYLSDAAQGGITEQIDFTANVETGEVYILLLSEGQIIFTRDGVPVYEDEKPFVLGTLPGPPSEPDPPTPDPDPDPLAVTVSPSSARARSSGDPAQFEDTTVATAQGGEAPYTFAWQRVEGDASITATQPASAATAYSYGGPVNATAQFVCEVTDADGQTATSSRVTVYADDFDDFR